MTSDAKNPAPTNAPAPGPATPLPTIDRRTLRIIPARPDGRGVLASLRVRKKLILLHTLFSLALGAILLLAMRPAVSEVVERAEADQARVLLEASLSPGAPEPRGDVTRREGTADELGLPAGVAASLVASPGHAIATRTRELGACAAAYAPPREGRPERFVALAVRIPEARLAVVWLYALVVGALVACYALVAGALELFVLPEAVYRPIRRLLDADAAVREGRAGEEMIPQRLIPADELGEIMQSRNETIARLRAQESALSDALARLEQVATDLRRKNHLLEAARRNLADADRLAGLGMMSAGIAHELNTPLAVLKGLVERLHENPSGGMDPAQAALMVRVVTRLERLGEGLLDYARVRPPRSRPAVLRTLAGEAITLVRLDRDAAGLATFENRVSESLVAECDADRIVQVLVNLLRNAADAQRGPGLVVVEGRGLRRDGRGWASLTVTDEGPGIDPAILPRLFEPFASTRLDARGTGLGLAVAEGIVREHGGALLAHNRADRAGAVFEVLLPMQHTPAPVAGAPAEEVRA